MARDIDPFATDDAILEMAKETGEVIITHDLDFGKLLTFSASGAPSVIIFRIQKVNALRFFKLLTDKWDLLSKALENGGLVIIEKDNIRIRKLPIKR